MIDPKIIVDGLKAEYARGLSYKRIATERGVSYSYVHELATGRRDADGITIKKLNMLFPDSTLNLSGDTVQIDAADNNGSVVGVNNGSIFLEGLHWAMDKVLASDDLSDAEKVKFMKVLKK